MIAKMSIALVLACLLAGASFAQVSGGVVRQPPVGNEPTKRATRPAPQVQAAPQALQPVPQAQQAPQAQQPLNAPAERKGRAQKQSDKFPFGGLF